MGRPVRSDGRTEARKTGVLRLLPIAAGLALLLLLTLPAATASADPAPGTIVVGTTGDSSGSCSLRDAIASANNQDNEGGCTGGLASGTDTIEVPEGTYDITAGELLISTDVNIVGAGARTTDIDGATNGQRVFEVSSGTVTIGGVTIEDGSTSLAGPEPSAGLGGGILVDSGGSLTLQDSTVIGNEADSGGGGIDNAGSLTILRSTIENNTTGTGGIGGGIDDSGSDLSITNSTIMANSAQADGGGMFLGGTTSLVNDTVARFRGRDRRQQRHLGRPRQHAARRQHAG